MKRKNLSNEMCPIARSLYAVGDMWSLLIVRDAFLGRKRFSEFQTSIGVAKNILTDRLRRLVSIGVLELVPASDGSAYREYVLTEKGQGLYLVLMAFRQWGEGCLFHDGGQELMLVERETGEPIRPLTLQAQDGRSVKPEDVKLVPVP